MVEVGERLVSCFYEIVKLCRREDLLLEVDTLRKRIKFGAKEELLSLLRLKGIGRARARSLFDAGITTPKDLIAIDKQFLATIPKIGGVIATRIKRESIGYM